MHAIGGLYVDIDVECFITTERLLHGHDVVLQLEDDNPKSLNNGDISGSIDAEHLAYCCAALHTSYIPADRA